MMAALSLSTTVPHQPAQALTLQQEGFRPFPVVLVVFDELPVASLMNMSNRIDHKLFPNFARLAADSTWFRNTTTNMGFTKEALPALTTGRYPDTEGPRLVPQPPQSIFTLLSDSYEIRTDDRLPAVCPRALCHSSSEAIDTDASAYDLGAFGRGSRGSHLLSFLDLIETGGPPRFYFLHLVMPHSPWRYLPSGQRYLETEPMPGEKEVPGRGKGWRGDPWLVQQGFQRHLLQTQLADRALGALMDKLQASGLYERSLIVVMADHGEGFVPGLPKRAVTQETLGHIAPVPLFIRRPLQERGRVSDAPAETVDIVPTIADVLNLSRMWPGLDGISLFEGSVPRDRHRAIEGVPLDPRGGEKYDLVFRKYSTFGFGQRGLDLFKLAPGHREHLIGLTVGEVPVAAPQQATAQVPQLARYESVDPAAEVFPSLLEGTLEGVTPGRRVVIAVAVNGLIAAITRTFQKHGETRFSSMLSPDSFGAGGNELELFEVVRTGQTLIPLLLDAPT